MGEGDLSLPLCPLPPVRRGYAPHRGGHPGVAGGRPLRKRKHSAPRYARSVRPPSAAPSRATPATSIGRSCAGQPPATTDDIPAPRTARGCRQLQRAAAPQELRRWKRRGHSAPTKGDGRPSRPPAKHRDGTHKGRRAYGPTPRRVPRPPGRKRPKGQCKVISDSPGQAGSVDLGDDLDPSIDGRSSVAKARPGVCTARSRPHCPRVDPRTIKLRGRPAHIHVQTDQPKCSSVVRILSTRRRLATNVRAATPPHRCKILCVKLLPSAKHQRYTTIGI